MTSQETVGYLALSERLHRSEDEHELRTGRRLTTQEFYDDYRRGGAHDVAEAIEWASYYELLRALGSSALDESRSSPAERQRRERELDEARERVLHAIG